jgi:hypothetical protein
MLKVVVCSPRADLTVHMGFAGIFNKRLVALLLVVLYRRTLESLRTLAPSGHRRALRRTGGPS